MLFRSLMLEGTQYVASFRGRQMLLTKSEWQILVRLTKTAGRVVPREELRSLLWSEDHLSHDRELDQIMTALNAKNRPATGPHRSLQGSPEPVTGSSGKNARFPSRPDLSADHLISGSHHIALVLA